MRRRFNTSERSALYLAANGKCESCGTELQPGWHADHVEPFSKGGVTDVINGSALCPSCNLAKGSKFMADGLRSWQRDSLATAEASKEDFMLAACPGAGKSLWAISLALRAIERREVERIHIVVPGRHLVEQIIRSARARGLKLVYADNAKRYGIEPPDYHGVVTTYQSIHSAPLIYRKAATQRRTLVILDEIHHGAERSGWGDALKQAYEFAYRRVLMTGTPFRSDGYAIPFCRYGTDQMIEIDYAYSFRNAWAEPNDDRPIRFLNFHKIDARCQWIKDGTRHDVTLSEVDADREPAALQNALMVTDPWWRETFNRAHETLMSKRMIVADAAGLVITQNQSHARQVAEYIQRNTGTSPALVISDSPEAGEVLREFIEGTSPWCVSVQMVSEGVDVPRCEVEIYATNILQRLFFAQAVGRPIRRRGQSDAQTADIFLPMAPTLMQYASEIEDMQRHALRDREIAGGGTGERQAGTGRIDLGNREARYAGVDQQDGTHVPALDIMAVSQALPTELRQYGPDIAASLGRANLLTIERQIPISIHDTESREEKQSRVERLARKCDRELHDGEYGSMNKELFRQWGVSRQMLSDEQLEAQERYMLRRLEEAT